MNDKRNIHFFCIIIISIILKFSNYLYYYYCCYCCCCYYYYYYYCNEKIRENPKILNTFELKMQGIYYMRFEFFALSIQNRHINNNYYLYAII